MAKALEVFIPGFTPSPLQKAAIKRIHEYQEELKRYGMFMRTGMELEFMSSDKDGRLVPCVLNLDRANEFLRDPEKGLQWFKAIKTDSTSEYELVTGDNVDDGAARLNVQSLSPIGVAATTAAMKKNNLKEAYLNTTCLTKAANPERAPFTPVFRAYPYPLAHEDTLSHYEGKASALYVNVSLYNKNGENLFTKDDDLLQYCARSLVHVQDAAGLAFLPRKNSLKRLSPKTHTSVPGGLGMFEPDDEGTRKTHSSVNIRGGKYELGGEEAIAFNPHLTRIENRLPGADADPFVSLAVTMGALVRGVHRHAAGEGLGIKPKYPIASSHKELVEKLETSRDMYKLLGEDLFSAILNSYDKTQGSER